MVGESLLVAPVLQQGQRCRTVYLPAGEWFDYWTREKYSGKQYILKQTPLEVCPIYIKAGSIIPNYQGQNYVGEKDQSELILDVYPGEGCYTHYQDDGESFKYRAGEYNLYRFTQRLAGDKLLLELEKTTAGYERSYENFILKINGMEAAAVKADGQEIAFSQDNGRVLVKIPATTKLVEVIEK